MHTTDWFGRLTLLAIVVLLAMIALHPFYDPSDKVLAQSARFDHVYVVSPSIIYKGATGLLVMDRRNANVWFIPKDPTKDGVYREPVFVVRVPFEKLDQAPQ